MHNLIPYDIECDIVIYFMSFHALSQTNRAYQQSLSRSARIVLCQFGQVAVTACTPQHALVHKPVCQTWLPDGGDEAVFPMLHCGIKLGKASLLHIVSIHDAHEYREVTTMDFGHSSHC